MLFENWDLALKQKYIQVSVSRESEYRIRSLILFHFSNENSLFYLHDYEEVREVAKEV